MSQLGPVVARQTIDAPQSAVWQLLTDATAREAWWPLATIEPEIDGEVSNGEDLTGTVDVMVPGLTLGFRWKRPEDQSDRTVVIMIRPEDDNYEQTRITVIESGFATLEHPEEAVQGQTESWKNLFAELSHTVGGAGTPVDSEDLPSAESGDSAEEPVVVFEELDPVDSESFYDSETTGDAEPTETAAEEPENVEPEDTDPDSVNSGSVASDAVAADTVDFDLVEPEVAVEAETVPEPETEQMPLIEIIEDAVLEAEELDSEDFDTRNAILLPEVGHLVPTETGVNITADLGVDGPVDVEETSEWELLLRGDDSQND